MSRLKRFNLYLVPQFEFAQRTGWVRDMENLKQVPAGCVAKVRAKLRRQRAALLSIEDGREIYGNPEGDHIEIVSLDGRFSVLASFSAPMKSWRLLDLFCFAAEAAECSIEIVEIDDSGGWTPPMLVHSLVRGGIRL